MSDSLAILEKIGEEVKKVAEEQSESAKKATEAIKEIEKRRFHNDTNELMDSRNTTLYNQKNQSPFHLEDDYVEENDGPTLVFDDFDQSADLEVPAYIRKQNR